MAMDDNAPLVLMTWIGRKSNVRNVKKSTKDLVIATEKILPEGLTYTCCETFDTYLRGGLYPVLHMASDKVTIKNILSSGVFISSNSLGENNMVEQAVYKEVASVNPPGGQVSGVYSAVAVAAFRSIEEHQPEILLREWKAWTGSRGFMIDILQCGLRCNSIKFYVKIEPKDDPTSFYYVVTTEVGIEHPSDEGLFVDVMQRFRVERWLGFRTIYKPCTTSKH